LISEKEEAYARIAKSNGGYHYYGSAKTMAQIGKAFAEALVNTD
jgi:trimethylamine:corrinoid methyltransferase-like protein